MGGFNRIQITDRDVILAYRRIEAAGFFWWFNCDTRLIPPFAAGIRAHRDRWTFAYAKGDVLGDVILEAFTKAAGVFPGLRRLYVEAVSAPMTIDFDSLDIG